ncbi:hypothetical protein AB0383_20160 [Amycolatopsis sp. NPDC051373]|uniref:hypothetical protein n=1 Tax=Amycolatopsis sp. NPDC051373 TaxID=3155801 RepID=UPI00344BC826
MSDLSKRIVESVRRELLGRKGILDDVDDDIQVELCGAVAATVVGELAAASKAAYDDFGDTWPEDPEDLEILANEIQGDN